MFRYACMLEPTPYAYYYSQHLNPRTTSVIGMTMGSHGKCMVSQIEGPRRSCAAGEERRTNGVSGIGEYTCDFEQWSMDECMAYRPTSIAMPGRESAEYVAIGGESAAGHPGKWSGRVRAGAVMTRVKRAFGAQRP